MLDRASAFFINWCGTFTLIGLGLFLVFGFISFGVESSQPQTVEKSSNPSFNVEFLFEKDGVKVYRFNDAGQTIYYIDSRGSTQWTEFNGKTSHEVQVNTVN